MLKNKVAIITGATRGLGQAVAVRFAAQGAHVVSAARGLGIDVTNLDDVYDLVQKTFDRYGRIDILVCCAGVYGPIGALQNIAWDEWVQAIQTNLLGTVLCCRAVIPIMRVQQAGKIITLSGGGATMPMPNFSAYASSKAAVVRFTETLARELADRHIDVNAVAPGALNTGLLDEVLAAGEQRIGIDAYDRARLQKEEGGTPMHIPVDLIEFLASERSNGISGRLISAVWDDWRDANTFRNRLSDNTYTLRRITQ